MNHRNHKTSAQTDLAAAASNKDSPSPNPIQARCFNIIDTYLQGITTGQLVLTLPNGNKRYYGDRTTPHHIQVLNYNFFTRLAFGGDIGLGDSWTAGEWECNDLPGLLELLIINMHKRGLSSAAGRKLSTLFLQVCHHQPQKRHQQAHRPPRDLSSKFYQQFLDPETMMHSCAVFLDAKEPLPDAQHRKILQLTDLADIRAEHQVLEIGCGWGGFAIEVVKATGCHVTTITLSKQQYHYTRQRVEREGLGNSVEVQLKDYREMEGSFDRIVCIEMLETLEHVHYGPFFESCDQLLRAGGRVALQLITIPDQRYQTYRHHPDWLQKHFMQSSTLPSLTELTKAMTRSSGFTIEHLDNIGVHYAETLRRWRRSFLVQRENLLSLGYDATMQRRWIYYFCYCEAAFQTRYINTLQLLLARPAE